MPNRQATHDPEIALRWLLAIQRAPGLTFSALHRKVGGKALLARELLDDLEARQLVRTGEEEKDRPGPSADGHWLTSDGAVFLEDLQRILQEFPNLMFAHRLLRIIGEQPDIAWAQLRDEASTNSQSMAVHRDHLIHEGYVELFERDRKGHRHRRTAKGDETFRRIEQAMGKLVKLDQPEVGAKPPVRAPLPRAMESWSKLTSVLKPALRMGKDGVTVHDPEALRGEPIDALAQTAVFAVGPTRDRAREIVRALAHQQGLVPASLQRFYLARARGHIGSSFTVPAFNIRGATYEVARAAFRAAKRRHVGAMIFEIARSETGYTEQRPAEYAVAILAAGVKEGFRGPLFLQGDHYQFTRPIESAHLQATQFQLENLVLESLDAGFRQIDVDASPLVNPALPTIPDQQALNAVRSARLTSFVRDQEDVGPGVCVGAEVSEIGGPPTSLADVHAFMDRYTHELRRLGQGPGPAKLSVNTLTGTGGSGGAQVSFDLLSSISEVCRETYGMAGVAQHGTAELPDAELHRFVKAGACELHVATGLQNALLDHPEFPHALRARMDAWVKAQQVASPGQTLQKLRKRAFGPFKRDLWAIEPHVMEAIGKDLEAKFDVMFQELGVVDTMPLVDRLARKDPPGWGAGTSGSRTARSTTPSS